MINGTPAEIMRGLSFAPDFTDKQSIVRDGGELFGSPGVAGGVVELDGVGDYVKYALTGSEFSPERILGIELDFIPNFLLGDGSTHYIIDSAPSSFGVYKRYDGQLRLNMGGGVYIAVVQSAYEAHWNDLKRNTIVVSGVAGSVSFKLNGVEIDASTGFWAAPTVTSLYIGASNVGGGLFAGSISQVKVFKAYLTLQEAIDFYTQKTYRYMESAVVDLPMRMEQHDPTNNQTLDESGNGNNAVLGDGAGNNEPVKLPMAGYGFDGQYMDFGAPITGIAGASKATFAVLFKVNDFITNAGVVGLGDSSTRQPWVYTSGPGSVVLSVSATSGGGSLTATGIGTNQIVSIIGAYDGTALNMYVDGHYHSSVAFTGNLTGGAASNFIGKMAGFANSSADVLGFVSISERALTPTQAADLHLRMIEGVTNV